jgi:uncharacterized membrane protein YidH (DUF202 family)
LCQEQTKPLADNTKRKYWLFSSNLHPNTGSLARDILAQERTFLAWLRTAIVFFGLGVGISEYRKVMGEDRTDEEEEAQEASLG